MATNNFSIYDPAADWITLTTWEESIFGRLLFTWLSHNSDIADDTEGSQVRILGYSGRNYHGAVFLQKDFTNGEHCGKRHYMVRVSGRRSDYFLDVLGRQIEAHIDDINCTRLDLQVTVPGSLSNCRDIVDDLRNKWSSGRGRNPKISLIESDLRTIYIGSRQSTRMVRVYEKLSDIGEIFTRFEVELKGHLASEYLRRLLNDRSYLKVALAGEFRRFPVNLADDYIPFSNLREYFLDSDHVPPVMHIRKDTDTIRWLRTQVDSAVRNAIDHDNADTLRDLFMSWLLLVDRLDD